MFDSIDDRNGERLLKDLSNGAETAAEELLRMCGPAIFSIIRRRLGTRSPRFDSADVAQAVWASFFGNRDRLQDFATIDDLVRYLSGMALKKVLKAQRREFFTKKRAVRLELRSDAGETAAMDEICSSTPTPSQFAIADEAWKQLLAEVSPSEQRLLFMRLEGKTQEEIAAELGISVRTVGRIMNRLLQRVAP
jgi:RNA polymerase sigma factor (sigma-70 family)